MGGDLFIFLGILKKIPLKNHRKIPFNGVSLNLVFLKLGFGLHSPLKRIPIKKRFDECVRQIDHQKTYKLTYTQMCWKRGEV